jgi:hypothetical protein
MTSTRHPVAQAILTYLSDHTEAEDTIEGITEWWLLESEIKHRRKEVEAVLDRLVAESLITAHRTQDSRIRYRLNHGKINEIKELIK